MAGLSLPPPPAEIAVIGLARSGVAAASLLARAGYAVYASDAGAGAALSASAATVGALGAAIDVGHHDLARIARAALVVASPGVPPGAPPLEAARRAGVPIVGEVEVALHFLPRTRVVAITGTNGKTTTTALVGHLLRSLGQDAEDVGNIGTPVADLALRLAPPEWMALEMSSFQLHDTPSLRPDVGVLTNLSPDHLDRYASVAEYYADKKRLFANAGARSQWVVNRDDPAALDLASGAAGTHWHFSVRGADAHAWYDRAGDRLVVLGAPLAPRPSLALLGDHNVANALAAALAVMVAAPAHRTDEARRALADGLNDFRALKHRLEPVATSGRSGGGVQWINDSKATNVSATLVALAGMTRPTILLLGGRHKGEPYTVLGEQLRRVGKRVLAYGEAAPLIERDLAGVAAVERMGSDFGAVIARARALAEPGDVVLLSPACSSFDMFKNYEERGEEFKRLAGQGTEY